MADVSTLSRPLARESAPHYYRAGRKGPQVGAAGVTLSFVSQEDRFNVEARRGRGQELLAALAAAFGRAPVDAPRTVSAGGFDFIGIGPMRWHAISRGPGAEERRAALTAAARDAATVVDLSHGFAAFRLSGPNAREALASFVPVDLDEASFPPGACAMTMAHMMSVQIRRTPDGAAYECAVARSFGGSLLHALTSTCERFGLEIEPPR